MEIFGKSENAMTLFLLEINGIRCFDCIEDSKCERERARWIDTKQTKNSQYQMFIGASTNTIACVSVSDIVTSAALLFFWLLARLEF